jgi:hypothetical protein
LQKRCRNRNWLISKEFWRFPTLDYANGHAFCALALCIFHVFKPEAGRHANARMKRKIIAARPKRLELYETFTVSQTGQIFDCSGNAFDSGVFKIMVSRKGKVFYGSRQIERVSGP